MYLHHNRTEGYVTVNELLIKENIQEGVNEFNRYDILVRYFAIRRYLDLQGDAFNWYHHMQIERMQDRANSDFAVELFKKWIVFFLYYRTTKWRNIQVELSPIVLAKDNGRMIDGSHRLSCCVYFDEIEVPIRYEGEWGNGISYRRDWFVEHKFDLQILEQIDGIYKEILQKRNL